MTKKIHNWTEADEARLEQAVADLEPFAAACEDRNWPRARFWDAVAGRMAPDVLVSGKACWERHKKIQAAKAPPTQPDAWAAVAEQVEEYERDLAVATYDELTGVNRRLDSIETMISNNAGSDQVEVLRTAVLRTEAKLDRLLAELGVNMSLGEQVRS